MTRPPDQLDYVLFRGDRHSRFSSETSVRHAIEIMKMEEQMDEARKEYVRRQKAHIYDRNRKCRFCGQSAQMVSNHQLPCNGDA